MEDSQMREVRRNSSLIFTYGVLISGFLIILGLIISATTGDTSNPYGIIESDWLIHGDPFFSSSHILFLGFLMLIATPIFNVASTTFLFIKGRDGSLAIISSFILLVLIASLNLNIR